MIIIKDLKKEIREITSLGSLPDIDTDFEGQQRPRVKEYMERRFGKSQVVSLGTYTTMQIKAAITDLARYEGVPIQIVRRITAKLRDEEGMKSIEDFFTSICRDAELREFVKSHTELINDMMICLNSPKTASIHACGTVIFPEEKTSSQWVPTREQNGLVVTEWEGSEIEETGFLKEDILGIAQLDKLADMLKLIEQNHGIKLDLYKDIPLDDPMVFEYIKKGFLNDVFHFGAKGLSSYCVQMQPESLDEMGICAALYRPGPIENNIHNEYILRKKGDQDIRYPIGTQELLKGNLGLMCIEENCLVKTLRGDVKIKDVVENDYVLTGDNSFQRVLKVLYKGEKEVYRIHTSFGEDLYCTSDHRVMTSDGWCEVDKLVENKSFIKGFWTEEEKQVEEASLKDWLVGYFIAEGSCGSSPYYTVTDKYKADKLRELILQLWSDCIVECSRQDRINEKGEKVGGYRVQVKSKKGPNGYFSKDRKENPLTRLLKEEGIWGLNCYNKVLPKSCSIDTISGIIEGDGSLHTSTLAMNNENLIDQIYRKLLQYRVYCNKSHRKDGVPYISFNDVYKRLRYRIINPTERELKKSGYKIPINQIEFDFGLYNKTEISNIKTSIKNNRSKKIGSLIEKNLISNIKHSIWGEVLSIESVGVRRTYDLSIENNHEFVCGGLLVHNCYQEDIMRLCQELADFDLETTDSVRKCIWEEELFWTPEGAVKIKDIKQYTPVITYNIKECRFKWNKVSRKTYNKEKECIRLNMQGDNHFTCTPDHKLLTEVGWLEAKDCVGHYIYKDLSRRFGKLSKSKEELYLMVALLTEGSLGTTGSCAFVNKDEVELNEFKRCYKEFFDKELKEQYNKYTGCTSFRVRDSDVIRLGLEFVKSDDKKLPEYVFSLNEECQLFVIGKMIDFDGYIASKKGGFLIGYSSKSKKLIDQMNILFSCLGVLTTTNRRSFEDYPENYYDIGISSIEDALKIKQMIEPYSIKIKEKFKFKLEDFDLDSYSQYKIPSEIWQPIIRNLINNSGYNCNELLGSNILNYGIDHPFDLTYRRVEKILKLCGRNKYLENVLKREFCFLKVESYDEVGKLPVYDFTMTSDRSPYAFVGGLLAHNCIGKKLTSKMKLFGDKFVEGYVKKFGNQGVTEEYARDLWKQMEEFGKYSFNKSHAIAYSRNGYNCIWLKIHYPIEFWSVTFSHAELKDFPYYINEINRSGDIEIKPVDINKSDINIVSDIQTNSMYWALNSVKQCGEKAQQFISNERKQNGEFFSLDEFIDRCVVKNSPVNKSVIENLIYSGAFDNLENIQHPSERLRLIESYRENKRVKILEDKDLLTSIIKARKEKNDWWWTLQQKKLSGFALFDYEDLVNKYHEQFYEATYYDLSQIKYLESKTKDLCVIIGGYVLDIIERKSKKGKFCIITLESNYEFMNVIVFPELYSEYESFLQESKSNILLVDGYIQWDKWRGEYCLMTNLNTSFTVLS